MIILLGTTTFVLYVVLFRMANRESLRSSLHWKEFSSAPAEFEAKPLAMVSDDAVMLFEPGWTALDDQQLDRFLKSSSP